MANHSNRHRSSINFIGYVVDYGGVKMKIPKKLEEKRDELAREFEDQAWRAAPYTEVTIDSSFRGGFDSACNLLLPEIEKLEKALLRLTVRLDESASIHDIKPSAEIVNNALQSLREFLGEESEGGDE